MNYLAHIYLSGEDEELKIGNFIADSVKGKNHINYPKRIKQGIILHRAIDSFTDVHPTVYQSTHRLFKKYSHYSTVIVDVLYDHFLAKNWRNYHDTPLKEYVTDFYRILKEHFLLLPKPVQNFYPYMVSDNWLLSYAEVEGIKKILFQMNRRVKTDVRLDESVEELTHFYSEFEQEFTSFFAELIQFAKEKRKAMDNY